MMDEPFEYLGRFQQGQELPLVLQCTNAADVPADPAAVPTVTIYRDVPSGPLLVQTVELGADLRGVQAGLFRRPLFLGHLYATSGRYLLVYRWAAADATPRVRAGSFLLLPGGSADGSVIALHYVERPDARHLLYQTDSGSLLRGRNPR